MHIYKQKKVLIATRNKLLEYMLFSSITVIRRLLWLTFSYRNNYRSIKE